MRLKRSVKVKLGTQQHFARTARRATGDGAVAGNGK